MGNSVQLFIWSDLDIFVISYYIIEVKNCSFVVKANMDHMLQCFVDYTLCTLNCFICLLLINIENLAIG